MRSLDSPILEDNQIKSVGVPTDPDDVVTLRLLDDLELVADIFYSFSTTPTTIPNNYVDIPIAQSIVRQDSNYNVISNTEVEITDDGDYTVSYSKAMDLSTNNRGNSETAIFVDFNDGNGYQLVVDSVRPAYHRIRSQGRDTAAMIRRRFSLISGTRLRYCGAVPPLHRLK